MIDIVGVANIFFKTRQAMTAIKQKNNTNMHAGPVVGTRK